MSQPIRVGSKVPVSLQLADRDTGKYPRCLIYDNDDNLLTTLDLSHDSLGRYVPATNYTMPDEEFIVGQYVVYSDSGHTTIDKKYETVQDAWSRADNIYEVALTDITTAGTVGEALNRLDDIETDTQDIQSRLPAALVGGRMDSSVGAMATDVVTAAAIAADAITSSELATSAVNEIRDAILSDSTPFAGANIDAAISSRSDFDETTDPVEILDTGGAAGTSASELVADIESQLSGTHGAGSWATATGFAVPGDAMGLTAAAVDDIWDEDIVLAHGTADTSGLLLRALGALISQRTNNPTLHALLNIPDTIATYLADAVDTELVANHGAGAWTTATGFAVPGDAMDLVTDAVDANAVATTGANEIRDAILSDSTPFAGANIDAAISSRSDFDETTDPVELLDSGGTAGTSAAELVADVESQLSGTHGAGSWEGATASAVATAVWSEALPGTYGVGEAGKIVGDNLDAAVSSRATQADILSDATPFAGANVDVAISTRSDFDETTDPVELLDSGGTAGTSAAELVSDIDAELTTQHGAGSWQGSSLTQQEVRDAMKLAPTAGVPAAGSVDEHLDDILADTAAMQPTVATNLDAQVSTRATQAQILSDATPFAGANIDAAISSRAAPGDAMTLTAGERSSISTAVWSEALPGTFGAGTAGFIIGTNLDVVVSTRSSHSAADVDTTLSGTHGAGSWATATGFAVAGDAMTLTAGERTTLAGVIDTTLTASHGAGSWTSSSATDWTAGEREQIRFRLAMDGTQTNPTTNTGTIEDILADTDSLDTTKLTTARANNLDNLDAAVSTRSSHTAADVDTVLTTSHGAGSWATATGFATPADVTSAQTAIIAEVDANEVKIDAIATTGGAGPWTTATGFAVPGDAMTLTTGERTAVATEVWSTLLPGAFGAGSAGYLVGTYLDAAVSSVIGAGLTASQATQLQELWFIHGLDNTKQLEVTPTTRKVPPDGSSIDQTIVTVGTTVTVTRS